MIPGASQNSISRPTVRKKSQAQLEVMARLAEPVPPIAAVAPAVITPPAVPAAQSPPRNTAELLALAEKETRLSMAASGNGGHGGVSVPQSNPTTIGLSGIQLIEVAVRQTTAAQA